MTRLYFQYQINSVVSILTQTLPSFLQGEDPIVEDLVVAFQRLPNSPLASVFVDQIALISSSNGIETIYNSWDPLTILGENGRLGSNPLLIRLKVKLDVFLSTTLGDIEKALCESFTFEIKRKYSKSLQVVERWEEFKTEAASYEYPTILIGTDICLPNTSEIKFKLRKDVHDVVSTHLENFNRIFRDEGKRIKFETTENQVLIIGSPDKILILDSKALTFIEVKTPNDLPVRHSTNNNLCDLLKMYKEDIQSQQSKEIVREDIGRMDVRSVIHQAYGYMALNKMTYGCVTCYDVTYFFMRPKNDTLLISHPIFNSSRSPSLLQALYFFVQLVLQVHDN